MYMVCLTIHKKQRVTYVRTHEYHTRNKETWNSVYQKTAGINIYLQLHEEELLGH